MLADILIWWLVAQLMGLAGLLPAGLLLGALPDRGYAYAKTLGLLLVGYLAWLLAMLGLAPFGRASLVVALLAVLGLSLWLAGGPRAAWAQLTAAPRAQGLTASAGGYRLAAMLSSEAVFLAALLLATWMRAHDPTPWGTERPMDFAFFNAVQRTGLFPPNDPWLAGFSINYYYFGYVLMGAVALLSGLAPAVAYNLALALIFALTAQGVAGTIANLMALASAGERRPARAAMALFPLLGVIFVLLAGNQSGAVQVALGSERAVALNGRELAAAAGQAARGAEVLGLPAPVQAQDFGLITELPRQDKAENFNWWWPSRSLWDEHAAEGGLRRYNITEFPLFSFRLGDMHPHVMALPFGLLAAALALATLAQTAPPQGRRRDWAALLLAGLVIGSLYVINSWDLPSYLLLYAGALAVAAARAAGPFPWLALARSLLLVTAAAYLLFLPFYLTFHSLVGAAAPLIDLPLLGRLTSIIAPYTAGRSGLHAFLIIFGLFAVAIVTFVYLAGAAPPRPVEVVAEPGFPPPPAPVGAAPPHPVEPVAEPGAPTPHFKEPRAPSAFALPQQHGMASGLSSPSPASGRGGQGVRAAEAPLILHPSSFILWLPPLLLLGGLLVGFPLLALGGLVLLALWRALALAARPAESFALLLAALGCAIIFGTELIFIRDLFGTRMNTIFKFYYQVWLLWGLLAPFALWWALRCAAGRVRLAAWGAALATAALLAGALVYPWLVLGELGRGDLLGLDGRTPRELSAAGEASVAWLRQTAAPGSVVLEAIALDNAEAVAAGSEAPRCGGSYNGEGYAGIAAATGLPTVLGWDGHQRQWRGGDPAALAELGPRCADVDTIYRTLDANAARDLLARYGVAYVYIGSLERQRYPAEALSKFVALGDAAFSQEEVTIYRLR